MNAWLMDLIPWTDALGRSLLHFLWQGALIGLLYVALRPFCATMAARYRLGMGTLLLMLVCPLATLIWLRPVADAHSDPFTSAVSSALPALSDAVSATTTRWASAWQAEQLLPWFVALWLLGVCAIATRSFLHWRRLARVVRASVGLPRDWQMRLIQLRQRFGVLRPVRLLSSMHVASPTLIGWLKPVILLPASLLSGFTPAQIELIIAHELSHVRRFDYLANLVQVVIETLLFYHPAVHWISRDVRQARESCCDDLVLTLGGGDAVAYARTLADLEELHHDFGPAVPALGVGGGVLLARIRRLVDPTYVATLEPLPRSNGITLPMLLACVGLGLALLRMHLMPASMAEVVAQAPTRSVALMSGNAQLVAPRHADVPAEQTATAPALVADALAPGTAIKQAEASATLLVDRPARPHIALAALQVGETSVANARTHLDFIAPSIHIPAVSDASAVAAPSESQALEHAVSVGPVPDQIVQARYPIDALRNGMTGKVDLDFRIAADGSVRDVRVLRAQPSGVFDQAAVAALRQWHFAVTSQTDVGKRYARSFAFAHADSSQETCREVTGSHICRRQTSESSDN